MRNLSMVESEMPPGFRFHPRDEELICDYLMKKVTYCDSTLMIEVDLNKTEPWEIPETACVGGKEWYFYSQRDRKYAIGLRTNRATASGYWKATGKDRHVIRKGVLVGMRKTLVFYSGRAPKGAKTQWVMHEFRLENTLPYPEKDWVLCRVLYKKREQHVDKDYMERSYLYDEMTQNHNLKYNEQLPCFSSIYPTFTSSNIMEPNNIPTFEQMSSHDFTASDNDIVLKACLNHFTKFETNSTSLVKPSTMLFGDTSLDSCYLYV